MAAEPLAMLSFVNLLAVMPPKVEQVSILDLVLRPVSDNFWSRRRVNKVLHPYFIGEVGGYCP